MPDSTTSEDQDTTEKTSPDDNSDNSVLDIVDFQSAQSFPASDPPSWWGGIASVDTRFPASVTPDRHRSSNRMTMSQRDCPANSKIRMKRIYEPAAPEDGFRVLVDRLWPRNVSKSNAQLDSWNKDIAPSAELRRWYGHDPEKWEEFQDRYERELQSPLAQAKLAQLATLAQSQPVTLLYGFREAEISHAAVLRRLLTDRL